MRAAAAVRVALDACAKAWADGALAALWQPAARPPTPRRRRRRRRRWRRWRSERRSCAGLGRPSRRWRWRSERRSCAGSWRAPSRRWRRWRSERRSCAEAGGAPPEVAARRWQQRGPRTQRRAAAAEEDALEAEITACEKELAALLDLQDAARLVDSSGGGGGAQPGTAEEEEVEAEIARLTSSLRDLEVTLAEMRGATEEEVVPTDDLAEAPASEAPAAAPTAKPKVSIAPSPPTQPRRASLQGVAARAWGGRWKAAAARERRRGAEDGGGAAARAGAHGGGLRRRRAATLSAACESSWRGLARELSRTARRRSTSR